MHLARLLTSLRPWQSVRDVFKYLFLTASQPGLPARHRITHCLILLLKKCVLPLPDLLLQDANEYVQWLRREFGVVLACCRLVPTGADDIDSRGQRPAGTVTGPSVVCTPMRSSFITVLSTSWMPRGSSLRESRAERRL